MSELEVEAIINKPMPHCPCCGKNWPEGMRPLTYGEWFEAVGKAITELGEPKTAGEFMVMSRRAAVLARESHLRKCEVLDVHD